MADKIIQLFPQTDFNALDQIIQEQAAYYGLSNPVDVSNMIFVFGSNEAGIHGAGAARYAMKYKGAAWGIGNGMAPNSQCYALPTKDEQIKTLPNAKVRYYVDQFLGFAKEHPELQFQLTAIGCGLAGFDPAEMAPLFDGAPDNCWFDQQWAGHIGIREDRIWGTF